MPRPHLAAASLVAVALLSGCAGTDKNGDDEYRAAIQTAEKGDTQGALHQLEAGIGEFPEHLLMRFALARLQYENGEKLHLGELEARAAAAKSEEDGKKPEAQKQLHDAADLHARATPHYRAALENLKLVAAKTQDDVRAAWAYYLLMRCEVFLEDWEPAKDHLEKAIEKGRPVGSQAAQWNDFLRAIDKEVERRKRKLAG